MEEKVNTTPEVVADLKLSKDKPYPLVQNEKISPLRIREADMNLEKAKVYTRLNNGNRRMNQAVDFLLDYIIEQEVRSQRNVAQAKSELGITPHA